MPGLIHEDATGGPPPDVKQRANKKAKLDADEEDSENDDLSELCWKAWGLFTSCLEEDDDDDDDQSDNNDDENEHDDITSLEEVCALLQSQQLVEIKPFAHKALSTIQTVADMLPLLLSVIFGRKAEHSLDKYYNQKDNHVGNSEDLWKTCQEYLRQSLHYYPLNAATLSNAANLGRVTNRTFRFTQCPDSQDLLQVCFGYPQAATAARNVRRQALLFLNEEKTRLQLQPSTATMDYNPAPEWMEVLVLNQMVGVEYTVDGDDNDDSAKEEHDDTHEQDNGYFSASSVEATARYMAAMLFSRMDCHDDALTHLRQFSGLTHRLHPNVWINKKVGSPSADTAATNQTATTTMTPVSFQGKSGVLPYELYQRMCDVFKPGAAFWKECDYANRGYFSFLRNIDENHDSNSWQPANLIDDVVLYHLLPLVQEALKSNADKNEKEPGICAYEWWVHSRSNQANLGHMLHFDSDEADLKGKRDVHHPLVSSVLHLTGDAKSSGATIILDQTPHSKQVAGVCWKSLPQDNAYMIFPGNLLHGVLPCPGREQQPSKSSSALSDDPHRLTFMIGWKTRQVPDQRKTDDSLYGPCAPLPSKEKASWVQEIHHGYGNTKPLARGLPRNADIRMKPLPNVSPAWEEINHDPPKEDAEPPLQVPSSLDRRFFVSGAPQCFLESLFEDDDT